MKTFRILDTGPLSAAANIALDKIIVEEVAAYQSPPTVRFLQFRPAAALVGYHQDVDLEIRKDFCSSQGIDMNRRLTGGGSILFQGSALGWELFGIRGQRPFRGSFETILHEICSIAAAGISRLGMKACFRPRNDIEVDGRKISGTGGISIANAYMFQGTLLVENEIELFLKVLRVPVEKLKRHEVESLMDRMCFLNDLVRPTPSMVVIKETLANEFANYLQVNLVPGELTEIEHERFNAELPYFQSPQWIASRTRPALEGEPIRSITQTEAGTMRVYLWLAPGGRRVSKALITGDFFAIPQRLIYDLEATLAGVLIDHHALTNAVLGFFQQYDGEIIGIDSARVAEAIASTGDRLGLAGGSFSQAEANELFLLNIQPQELFRHTPQWLLLPYCSKNLDCPLRMISGCDECGECEMRDCFTLARSFNLDAITIQSFEHLMEVLRNKCADNQGIYVGSCCEAFYSKHQQEMESVPARGVLINLDSTTCYDLGKNSAAYQGNFDNKTSLNVELIEKTLRRLNASS